MQNFKSKNLKFGNSFLQSMRCQIRVIYSLFLRETVTMYGDAKLGYLWVLIKTIFNVAVFAIIRMVIGATNMDGMHVVYFLTIGFTIFNIYSDCVGKCMHAVVANTSMLQFPHVKPIDIMLARCMLAIVTNVLVACIIIGVAMFLGLPFEISDITTLVFLVILCCLFCVSISIFIASINVFYPIFGKIYSFLDRFLFFASGVFFSVERFPNEIKEILMYNPLLQFIEGCRYACMPAFKLEQIYSYPYIIFLTITFLCFGLLLEQSSHRKLDL